MGRKGWTGDGFAGTELDKLTRRSFLRGAAGALAASSVSGVLVAGCGGGASGGGGSSNEVEEVTFLTIIPLNLGFISELLGDINGHFKREGLKVDIQSTRGSAQALQSVLQGSALITRAGAIETVLHNAEAGAPLVNIGMQWRKSPLGFVSSPKNPLQEPADWRGKKMGVPSEGGTSEITFDLMLASGNVPLDSVERQVTGFSVGTYDLIEKGRIDSYVIGSVETILFPIQRPEAIVVDPSKYVEEGQCYLTSQRQLDEERDLLQAYMNVVRATMDDVLNDQENDYMTIIEAIRKRHDFEELKEDKVAQGVIAQQVESWSYGGAEANLQTIPESWQKVYDQLVNAKFVEGGKNPREWFTNELVT
ncbi:MAG: hypothetical protein GEV03_04685 [Streptosporangiales bacterium]|nr:hypothetical protein [Streptosporangiales bacterium]